MRLTQIAAQLFTAREHLKTEADFAVSMKRIRALGYTAVQISGIGPIDPKALRRICDGEGLVICATHEPGKVLCEEPQKIIDRLGILGCRFTAYPSPHLPLTNLAEAEALAGMLNASGEKLRKAGLVLCYHNHNREFLRVEGRTILEWIYDLTAPANVRGEPDTYWVQVGGGDPVGWCRRLAGRMPLIHLKDYKVSLETLPDGKQDWRTVMTDIGAGNLDWGAILAEAEAAGCQWFIVENDMPGDAFAALGTSLEYLRPRCQPAL